VTCAAAFTSPTATDSAGRFPVSGVCLDVDDTLVDYTGSAKHALAAMLGSGAGIEPAWQIWQQITDEHALAVVRVELRYADMHAVRTRAFLAAVGEEVDAEDAARRERARAATMRASWTLFDDVRDCLDWLRVAGMKLAAVTNASGGHQRGKLADLGLADAFDAVVIAGEIGVAKPDPVIFRTACTELGCSPSAVAHVGDKLDADAMGAKHAGLHGVWLDRTSGACGHAAPEGVSVIDSLLVLPDLLVCELEQARDGASSGMR
jgi:putative hydrolase of the HAD superfamily